LQNQGNHESKKSLFILTRVSKLIKSAQFTDLNTRIVVYLFHPLDFICDSRACRFLQIPKDKTSYILV